MPIASALVARGHKLHVLIPPYDRTDDSGRIWQCDGVVIENMRVPPLPTPLVQISLARQLANRVRELSPDVIHVFKPVGPGALAQQMLGKQTATLLVDNDDWEGWGGWLDVNPYPLPQKWVMAWQEQMCLTHAHAVTCASHALIERTNLLTKKLYGAHLLPNGPLASWRAEGETGRTNRARTRARLQWQSRTIFIYAGTVSLNHDLDLALTSFTSLLRARPNSAILAFVVAGDGVASLRERVTQLGLDHAVEWSEYMPHNLLVELLSAADVGIFPYRDTNINRAKCSGKVLDYMNAGLPVLAHAVGMMKDYVRDGVTGLLSPVGAPDAFYLSMLQMVDNPGSAREMGVAGTQRIWKEFGWDDRIEALEVLYRAK